MPLDGVEHHLPNDWQEILPRDEDRVGSAGERRCGQRPDVDHLSGTDAPTELREQSREEEREDHRAEEGTDESLPRLVRRQRQKGRRDELLAEADSHEVGGHVIHNDIGHGEEEPEDAVQDVGGEVLALEDDETHSDDRPHVLTQLEAKQTGLQREHGRDEDDPVEYVGDVCEVLGEVEEVVQ